MKSFQGSKGMSLNTNYLHINSFVETVAECFLSFLINMVSQNTKADFRIKHGHLVDSWRMGSYISLKNFCPHLIPISNFPIIPVFPFDCIPRE